VSVSVKRICLVFISKVEVGSYEDLWWDFTRTLLAVLLDFGPMRTTLSTPLVEVVIDLLDGGVVRESKSFNVPSRVSTVSSVVISGGISVAIFGLALWAEAEVKAIVAKVSAAAG
jgi:hypothetical protein